MSMRPNHDQAIASPAGAPYPNSPVLASVWRGSYVESVHRGSWCLVDSSGEVLDGAGASDAPFFARSAIKCLQALPLFETGAAERFRFTDEAIALSVSSHNAEPCHVRTAREMLAQAEIAETELQCGAQRPGDREAREALARSGEAPGAIHNNCSGKHSGFLALAKHIGADRAQYLQHDGETQRLVRGAIAEVCDRDPGSFEHGIDGCSAPTYRMSLRELGTAFARVTNPEGLGPERRSAARRIVASVLEHPVLVAGRSGRLCTQLVAASGGTLFPKIGAEAVYAVGVPGRDAALAVKMDDGSNRGLHAVVVELLHRLGYLDRGAYDGLAEYRGLVQRNWAGLTVGRIEVH